MIWRWAKAFADTSGATSIEYALIAVGLAVAIVSAVSALGGKLLSIFTQVSAAMP